ncbi:MAG: PQQ-binding-like beta-propeller repeat protein [Planctomycetota bacterium]|nr:PQQ-binding-like beta-propeller repeat protein [Planctomycetota bacterium]
MSRLSNLVVVIAAIIVLFTSGFATAADWPMWRFDGRRSASTPERLSAELHLQWSTRLPAPRLAWPEDARLYFDASLEPIVAGQTLFIASSRNDALTAINTANGERRWQFFADGPIRFAPLAANGRVYFGADDGCFYCLQAEEGGLVWKFRAAPSDRRVIGNERFTSAWPIRGGPVLADGTLYFTAGVWPFEGTQLFVVKTDENPPQPRTVMLPDQVTPQGYLASDAGRVFIPSGRDKAAGFEIASGEFTGLSYQSRGKTDYHVTAEGDYLLHGDRVYDVPGKTLLANVAQRPISTREAVFGTWEGNLVAYDLADPQFVEKTDRQGKTYLEKVLKPRWSLANKTLAAATEQPEDALLSLEIKTADKFYGIHGSKVFAVEIADDGKPVVTWTTGIQGTPSRLIAADGKLFVATREGHIHCFGTESANASLAQTQEPAKPAAPEWAERVAGWLGANDDRGGYCLVVGASSEGLIDEIVRQSEMHVVVLDPSESRIDALRQRYDAIGLYGTRVSALVGDPVTANLPPYVMSLAVCESTENWTKNPAWIDHIHRCVRPYGGRAIFGCDDDSAAQLQDRIQQSELAQAELQIQDSFAVLTRAGALPGAADWTHEYGDSANSLMSQDQLVKAPLGVLWFGGPAAASELFFNRHFWPPSLTVNQGRMFFQGPEVFVAADIYTGRVLWKKKLPEGVSPGRRGNFFEKIRVGFHFLAADDAVYLSDGNQCEKINPATGETQATFRLKRPDAKWGTMRIWEDRLICTVFLPDQEGEYQPEEIVSIDRNTGEQIWRHEAEYTAPVAALGRDEVFFYDGILDGLYDAWKRKGLVPKSGDTGYLKALDIRTGKQIWQSGTSRAVTWLGVSSRDGVLVASNKQGIEAWDGESGQPLWEKEQDAKGFLGHPEELWDKVILWKDRIIDQRGPGAAYDVKTGKPLMTAHPLTGQPTPWEFTKTGHHCNYAIASPHMLTFRADTAGFLDLESGTTGRLNGFRSGCRNSLIPAGGVLNAPNFAHGCVCSYSLFTSLALVHTPDADVWTYNAYEAPSDTIQRVGVNLGAPGDRQDESGTLWLDHPNVGGPSPKVSISVAGENVQYFRGHSLNVEGELPWVTASGCEGLTSINVRLGKAEANQKCRVTLYFSEPGDVPEGDRVFDVALQGKPILEKFDIRKAAGSRHRGIVRSFDSVATDGTIDVTFTPRSGRSLLCGIEVVIVKN